MKYILQILRRNGVAAMIRLANEESIPEGNMHCSFSVAMVTSKNKHFSCVQGMLISTH